MEQTKRAGTGWTVSELAKAAGVTDSRIRQLLIEGKELKGRKGGGTFWIIPDGEARRWLRERGK